MKIIERLEKLDREATFDWEYIYQNDGEGWLGGTSFTWGDLFFPNPADAEIAATLRNNLPEILAVLKAAKEQSQRLQSLPWTRTDGGSDAPYYLSNKVWKDWNYGECQNLFEALQALEQKEGNDV